jgi:hypothetical protein
MNGHEDRRETSARRFGIKNGWAVDIPPEQTTSPGIVLASDEGVTWQELAPSFTAINEATRLHLIVFGRHRRKAKSRESDVAGFSRSKRGRSASLHRTRIQEDPERLRWCTMSH